MTLIVTAAHPDFAVMVADRRLSCTDSKGDVQTLDDDAGKVGYLVCYDAAVLYGITGLAYVGAPDDRTFDTMTWIADTLHSAPDGSFGPLMRHLAEQASLTFNSPSLRLVKDRRLTIVFSGFFGAGDPLVGIISNFELSGLVQGAVFNSRFEETIWRAEKRTNEASAIFLQGAGRAVSEEEKSGLNKMLLSGKPLRAVRGKAEDIVQRASDHPLSLGTVGKRTISCYLPAPQGKIPPIPTCQYATDVASPSLAGIDHVVLSPTGRFVMRDVRLGTNDGSPLVLPKQPRNAPCACGSGLKWKKCHGK